MFNLVVDPKDDAHVYALYSGYSRRWIKKGGTGQVFESYNGGHKWANITGNLPDAPADDLVVVSGKLVVATDVGVFITSKSDPGSYSRYGVRAARCDPERPAAPAGQEQDPGQHARPGDVDDPDAVAADRSKGRRAGAARRGPRSRSRVR